MSPRIWPCKRPGTSALRKQFKWQLVRSLNERGYDPIDALKLYRLIDWLMVLPETLELQRGVVIRHLRGRTHDLVRCRR